MVPRPSEPEEVKLKLRNIKKTNYNENDDEDITVKGKFKLDGPIKDQKFENKRLIKNMEGSELTFSYIQEKEFKYPIFIEKMDGLGMNMPKNLKTRDILNAVEEESPEKKITVQDCITQADINMSLKDFVQYFNRKRGKRERIYNVLSLEVSETKLDRRVKRPKIVDSLDWIDLCFPACHKYKEDKDGKYYPKVQKYCLMSVATSFTNFHIDFAGTSVWYHVLQGEKVFWLIEPTEKNLDEYVKYQRNEEPGYFLGNMVKVCERVTLTAGNTFFIPSGWIHAVWTPKDSIVFGGNFLHSFGILKQIKVEEIEEELKNDKKMKFPMLLDLQWYTLERYVHCLTGETFVDCGNFGCPKPEEERIPPKNRKKMTICEYKGLCELVNKLGKLEDESFKVARLKEGCRGDLLEAARDMLKKIKVYSTGKFGEQPVIEKYPHKPVESEADKKKAKGKKVTKSTVESKTKKESEIGVKNTTRRKTESDVENKVATRKETEVEKKSNKRGRPKKAESNRGGTTGPRKKSRTEIKKTRIVRNEETEPAANIKATNTSKAKRRHNGTSRRISVNLGAERRRNDATKRSTIWTIEELLAVTHEYFDQTVEFPSKFVNNQGVVFKPESWHIKDRSLRTCKSLFGAKVVVIEDDGRSGDMEVVIVKDGFKSDDRH